jgi:hypothetical protein
MFAILNAENTEDLSQATDCRRMEKDANTPIIRLHSSVRELCVTNEGLMSVMVQ